MGKFGIAGSYDGVLSPLETEVLKMLWPDKKLKVRHIFNTLKRKRTVALSSVAVILDRLHSKGAVDRHAEKGRGGVRYIYFPKNDKEGFDKSIVEQAVNKLIDKFGSTAVSYFNERFSKR